MITITPNATPLGPFPNPNRFPPQQQNGAPPRQFTSQPRQNFFQPFRAYRQGGNGPVVFDPEFDGKRLRKSAMRKTVDYNASIIKMLEARVWQRDFRDRRTLQPDAMYIPDVMPPSSYEDNPINAVTTRFVKTATNKMRCPIFCMAWTPEGRRLVTGASSGEFTLWNGLTFNFETILQAHDTPVRTMVWSHNEMWMVTADHAGYVKYWQSNMNNVKMFMAHQDAIRGISFSPSDSKFASCSDDGTIKIWDFYRCQEERTLRGHGADVKCVHWHPQKALIISGSKDNQQPVKLWDPKTGTSLSTIHAHKSTVMDVKWNANGNWFVTASRDHLLKLFDIRNLSTELQVFRGHKKEASSVAWHPVHEGLFSSGGSDGAILFWHVGAEKEVGAIEQAHDSIVWTLAWHPMGHILCSGSNDHTSKFWTRNRPGDTMRDKYNLNTVPASLSGLDEDAIDEVQSVIPGMGPEDKVELSTSPLPGLTPGSIPGLDDIDLTPEEKGKAPSKKVPYSKPIPKNFQAQWNDSGKLEDLDDDSRDGIDTMSLLNQLIEQHPGVKLVKELEPEILYIYGKTIKVEPNTVLYNTIKEGGEKLMKYLNSGAVKEIRDVIPFTEENADVYEGIEVDDDDDDEPEPQDKDKEDDSRSARSFSPHSRSNYSPGPGDRDFRRKRGRFSREGDGSPGRFSRDRDRGDFEDRSWDRDRRRGGGGNGRGKRGGRWNRRGRRDDWKGGQRGRGGDEDRMDWDDRGDENWDEKSEGNWNEKGEGNWEEGGEKNWDEGRRGNWGNREEKGEGDWDNKEPNWDKGDNWGNPGEGNWENQGNENWDNREEGEPKWDEGGEGGGGMGGWEDRGGGWKDRGGMGEDLGGENPWEGEDMPYGQDYEPEERGPGGPLPRGGGGKWRARRGTGGWSGRGGGRGKRGRGGRGSRGGRGARGGGIRSQDY